MSPGRLLCLLHFLLFSLFTHALKFDLQAQRGHSAKSERCIRNFVAKDTLVVVTAIVSGQRGDGMQVNMHVCFPEYCADPGQSMRTTQILGNVHQKDCTWLTFIQIKDAVGNDYGRPKDIAGEKRMAFTSLADTAFDVCFENSLVGRSMLLVS